MAAPAEEQPNTGATQVKILLSTQHIDLQLPEDTGPILVSTSKLSCCSPESYELVNIDVL